jgi:hypothetical protein
MTFRSFHRLAVRSRRFLAEDLLNAGAPGSIACDGIHRSSYGPPEEASSNPHKKIQTLGMRSPSSFWDKADEHSIFVSVSLRR